MVRQLNTFSSKGRYVAHADFGGSGAWFVTGSSKHDEKYSHSSWNRLEHVDELREVASRDGLDEVSFGEKLPRWLLCSFI